MELVLILGGSVAAFFFFRGLVFGHQNKIAAAWRDAASQVGGTAAYDRGSLSSMPSHSLRATIDGVAVTVTGTQSGKRYRTRVAARAADDGLQLIVAPAGIGTAIGVHGSLPQQVSTGDRAFDAKFRVMANDAERARARLGDAQRRRLVDAAGTAFHVRGGLSEATWDRAIADSRVLVTTMRAVAGLAKSS